MSETIAVSFSCGAASAVAAKLTLERFPEATVRVVNNPRKDMTNEIDRLRTDLAAANAERSNYKHNAEQRLIALREAERELRGEEETVAKLRTDLAAANAERSNYKHNAEQRLIALREAERELRGEEETVAKLRTDLAAARALLREARKFLGRIDPNDTFTLLARIDAALTKDEGRT